MNLLGWAAFGGTVLLSSIAHAQIVLPPLTVAQIQEAIEQGATRHRAGVQLRSQGVIIRIEGPFARIVNLSGAASRNGDAFKLSDIKKQTIEPVLMFHVAPDLTKTGGIGLEPIKQVYLTPHRKSTPAVEGARINPLKQRTAPLEYSPGFEGQEVGHELIATFEPKVVPAGGFDVVIEANGRQLRVEVPAESVKTIR